jgi:hypothetical protein
MPSSPDVKKPGRLSLIQMMGRGLITFAMAAAVVGMVVSWLG